MVTDHGGDVMLANVVVALLAGLFALYAHDRRQTTHTILRNYPVIGYFRYFAETFGEYMRQCQDLPGWAKRRFSRLVRARAYRSVIATRSFNISGMSYVRCRVPL